MSSEAKRQCERREGEDTKLERPSQRKSGGVVKALRFRSHWSRAEHNKLEATDVYLKLNLQPRNNIKILAYHGGHFAASVRCSRE